MHSHQKQIFEQIADDSGVKHREVILMTAGTGEDKTILHIKGTAGTGQTHT